MQKKLPFLPKYKLSFKQVMLAIVIFLAWLFISHPDLLFNFNSKLLGGSERDAGLYVFLLQHHIKNLFNGNLFNINALYPYTNGLAWSDNYIIPGFFASILSFFKLGIISINNSLVSCAIFLNGFLTFLLAFRLSGKYYSSVVAGISFSSLSYFSQHLGHPQLQYFFPIPLSLIFFFSFLSKRSIFSAFLLGLSITLSFLTAVYYSIFLCLILLTTSISVYILRTKEFSKSCIFTLLFGGLAGLLPIVFFLKPYLAVKQTFGQRELYEAYYFSANSFSYISSGLNQLIYSATNTLSHSEAHLFPGLVLLIIPFIVFYRLTKTKHLKLEKILFILTFILINILSFSTHFYPSLSKYSLSVCLWLLIISYFYLIYRLGKIERIVSYNFLTNRSIIAIIGSVLIVLLVVSFGPILNPEKGHLAFAPYVLLNKFFPGFNAIRVPARAGSIVLFCICLLIPFALNLLKQNKLYSKIILCLFLPLSLIENLHTKYPLEHYPQKPQIFNQLEKIKNTNSSFIVLPMSKKLNNKNQVESWSDYAQLNVNYMNWSNNIDARLVNGYSGQRSKLIKEFPGKLSSFPDRRSINTLSLISNLKYITIVSKYIPNFDAKEFENKLVAYDTNLKILAKDFQNNYLLEFNAETLVESKESFYLLVPNVPTGILELEIKVIKRDSKNTNFSLEILKDTAGKLSSYTNLDLDSDGLYHSYKIPITSNSKLVSPNKFRFNSGEKFLVSVKNRSFY